MIGDKLAIQYRLEGNKETHVLYDQTRPLGTLLDEHDLEDRQWWCGVVFAPLLSAVRTRYKRSENEKKAFAALDEKINSGNAVSVYCGYRTLWYYRSLVGKWGNDLAANVCETNLLILTASFRLSRFPTGVFASDIEDRTEALILSTNMYEEKELQILQLDPVLDQECVFATKSVLPLLDYYLTWIEARGMRLRICAICGNRFVAKTGHYKMCNNAECAKEYNKRNQRVYKQRLEAHEKSYEQIRDTLKKQINSHLKKDSITPDQANRITEAYAEFRQQAISKKHALKTTQDKIEFTDWLFRQERKIQALLMEN